MDIAVWSCLNPTLPYIQPALISKEDKVFIVSFCIFGCLRWGSQDLSLGYFFLRLEKRKIIQNYREFS